MTTIDFVLAGIVVVSAIVGSLRGFLREVIAVVTWIVAFWAAWQFGPVLAPELGGALSNPAVQPWAARVIVFVIVLFAGAAIGWLVGYVMQLSLFRGTDRLLGFLFGLARGVLVIGTLAVLGQTLSLNTEDWWRDSILMPYAESTANALRAIVGEDPVARARALVARIG